MDLYRTDKLSDYLNGMNTLVAFEIAKWKANPQKYKRSHDNIEDKVQMKNVEEAFENLNMGNEQNKNKNEALNKTKDKKKASKEFIVPYIFIPAVKKPIIQFEKSAVKKPFEISTKAPSDDTETESDCEIDDYDHYIDYREVITPKKPKRVIRKAHRRRAPINGEKIRFGEPLVATTQM